MPFASLQETRATAEVDCSTKTISSHLVKKKLKCWKANRRNELKEINKEKRLAFAEEYKSFDWSTVVIEDYFGLLVF